MLTRCWPASHRLDALARRQAGDLRCALRAEAAAKVLHATWQRCRVHTMRNLLAHAGRQGRGVGLAKARGRLKLLARQRFKADK
jgi:hypothetical protein